MTQQTRLVPTPGALNGLRVVEMGQLIAGPFCGKTLGEFGADVVKIEAPGAGDPLRNWRLIKNGTSVWWQVQSRNKRSVALDLRQQEGQDIARRLIAEADVLVENFRPGTLEGWGMSPEELHALNPGLVILRISGYGQTRSEEHTSELQSQSNLVCRLLLEKKKKRTNESTASRHRRTRT